MTQPSHLDPSLLRSLESPAPLGPQTFGFGDKAGEHTRMRRGQYGAWVHVVMAFVMQFGLLSFLGVLIALVAHGGSGSVFLVILALSPILGILGSYFTFRDRWRCVEAFSSRWCSGLAGLSLLYVPFVALIYANFRAAQKFAGR